MSNSLKTFLLFLLIQLITIDLYSANNNYFDYHKKIIDIEKKIISNNIEIALQDYERLFKEFDFVYPRDCLLAAEYAYYLNLKNISSDFLSKGFQYGLNIKHVMACPIFKRNDISFFNTLNKNYDSISKIQLKSINKEVLYRVIDNWWLDQSIRLEKDIQNVSKTKKGIYEYHPNIKQIFKNLNWIIQNFGFPGQKMIGIVDDKIFLRLGDTLSKTPLQKYDSLKVKRPNLFNDKETFSFEKKLIFLSDDITLIILYHQLSAFYELSKKCNLLDEIKKGNLYPNDYAILYDMQQRPMAQYNELDQKLRDSICPIINLYPGGFATFTKPIVPVPDSITNKNRSKIYMRTSNHMKDLYFFSKERNIISKFGLMEWK